MRFREFLNEEKKVSAGLLAYKNVEGKLNLFLAKPGGPFWKNKDVGAWDIPKGGINPGEDLKKAAAREFAEEIGQKPKFKKLIDLGIIKKPGKNIQVFAYEGNPKFVKSNTFEMDWPPKSGKKKSFPEVETAKFFSVDEAKTKINKKLLPLIDRLQNEI